MSDSILFAAPVQALDKEGPIWVEALTAKTYKTPYYGDVEVTPEKLERMVKNFKENVRGQEISTDFAHGIDNAKGHKASGWYRDFKVAPSSADANTPSLYAEIDFTPEAKNEIKNKEWRYFSLEWEDEWKDNDGNKFTDVIVGGGLTNRPIAKHMLPINFSEDMLKNELAEWEHSEPGTGSPPEPAKTGGEEEPDRKEGWRRPTPPDQDAPSGPSGLRTTNDNKEGSKVPEIEYVFSEGPARELFDILGVKSDTKPEDVVIEIKKRFGELDELKRALVAADQEKKFAEQYPEYWREHNQLMEKTRRQDAKAFSESNRRVMKAQGNGLVDTMTGLSPMAKERLEGLHVKFAEGSATIEEFEECVKTIMNGGIVQFGELGHNGDEDEIVVDTSSAGGVANAKKAFAEVMNKIREENPDKAQDTRWVLNEAAKKHPDLYNATKVAVPA